jgi:S-adenosylmethionine synthetase
VLVAYDKQSPDIAQGVNEGQGLDLDQGAGDQGLMFGYACRQTPELMPLPIVLAHALARQLAAVRRSAELPWLGPDGKTQVTVEYLDGRPVRVDNVVIAASHTAEALSADGRATCEEARRAIAARVVAPVLGGLADAATRVTVNGTGKFLVSGPAGDTGLTGRKNIVDTYGGWVMHGGGAFSGKDPTKVDRSAGYMARYVAKNVVAAGLADECLLQLAYCIGVVEPVSIMVNTFGSGELPDPALAGVLARVFPFSPRGMIDLLGLRAPIYLETACYGHFGRAALPWEQTDAIDELRAKARVGA